MIQTGVFDKYSHTKSFDINLDGKQGVYFLQVSNGENYEVLKIIN